MSFAEGKDLITVAQELLSSRGYDYEEVIGCGGSAICLKVSKRKYNQIFAAKIICITDENRDTYIPIIDNEIKSLCKLYHPNIISIYDFFSTEDLYVLILEYCPGGSLLEKITKNESSMKENLVQYFFQITNALIFCHSKGVSHRDIKPSNILFDPYGRIKLADFGLAHINDSDTCNLFSGSLKFVAPEVVQRKPYDPMKADIWSLGVTMFQTISGKFPFKGRTMSEYYQNASTGEINISKKDWIKWADILPKMLDPNPATRISLEDLLSSFQLKRVRKIDSFPEIVQRKQNGSLRNNVRSSIGGISSFHTVDTNRSDAKMASTTTNRSIFRKIAPSLIK